MPQLHFYVPEATAKVIRSNAKAAGVPLSQYLAKLVKSQIHAGWPDGYFESVIGAWEGKPLRRPPQGKPEKRESF